MRGTFDNVWHEGLIFKLKTYDVDGNLLKLLENCLTDRQQRVVLIGQTSSWQKIKAGVPQGSRCVRFMEMIHLYFSKVIDKNN